MSNHDDCQYADNWTAAEARFHRAKQALLDAQQRHGEAAQELLAARAQVQQMLDAVFPEAFAHAGREPGAEAGTRRL